MSKRAKYIEQIAKSMKPIGRFMHINKSERVLTHTQWIVLMLIRREGGITTRFLHHELHISSSAATQVVNELVKRDYVKREKNPRDGRSSILVLTEKAEKRIEEIKDEKINHLKKLFNILSDSELKKYAEIQSKLVEAVKKYE